jgi:hypothetical protein
LFLAPHFFLSPHFVFGSTFAHFQPDLSLFYSFVGDLPEDDHIEAKTRVRHTA